MKKIRLSSLERIVLESIGRGKTEAFAIGEDTSLSPGVVQEILLQMTENNLIQQNDNKYSLKSEHLSSLDIKSEVKEMAETLITSCLKNKIHHGEGAQKSNLGLQKVWMTEGEEKIFRAMLTNIETYLNNLKKQNIAFPSKLSEQKVIFWGVSDYYAITQEMLHI